MAVAVATLREVATVILSYLVYPKVFSMMHAVSSMFVLVGILLTTTCIAPTNGESVNHGKGTLTNTMKTAGSGIGLTCSNQFNKIMNG